MTFSMIGTIIKAVAVNTQRVQCLNNSEVTAFGIARWPNESTICCIDFVSHVAYRFAQHAPRFVFTVGTGQQAKMNLPCGAILLQQSFGLPVISVCLTVLIISFPINFSIHTHTNSSGEISSAETLVSAARTR